MAECFRPRPGAAGAHHLRDGLAAGALKKRNSKNSRSGKRGGCFLLSPFLEPSILRNLPRDPKSNSHCDIRTSFAKAFSAWRTKHNVPLKEIADGLGVFPGTAKPE